MRQGVLSVDLNRYSLSRRPTRILPTISYTQGRLINMMSIIIDIGIVGKYLLRYILARYIRLGVILYLTHLL
jgi:hypothetical protein